MREKRCRSPRRRPISLRVVRGAPHDAKRAALRNVFGSPPASTGFRATKRARWVAWVASATLQWASESTLRMERVDSDSLGNDAGPQHFCRHRGLLRVGTRNRAGQSGSGERTFSSGAPLALPNFRDSFVLRDGHHSKSKMPESWCAFAVVRGTSRPRAIQARGNMSGPAQDATRSPSAESARKCQFRTPVRACTFTGKTLNFTGV